MDPKKTTAIPSEIINVLRKVLVVSPETGSVYYKGSDKKFYGTYWIIRKNLFSKPYRELYESLECLEKGKEEDKPTARKLAEKNRNLLVSRVEELIEGIRKKEIILVDLETDGIPHLLYMLITQLKYLFKTTRDYKALDSFIKKTFNKKYESLITIHPEENDKDTKKLIELLQK